MFGQYGFAPSHEIVHLVAADEIRDLTPAIKSYFFLLVGQAALKALLR